MTSRLSVAIPATDAVVTDADVWDVATERAHLGDEFGTPVFKSVTELAVYLDPWHPLVSGTGFLGFCRRVQYFFYYEEEGYPLGRLELDGVGEEPPE